jgi:signal peptidase I
MEQAAKKGCGMMLALGANQQTDPVRKPWRIAAKPEVRLLVCMVLWTLLVAGVTRQYIVSAAVVLGGSMEPTLAEGDHCLLNRLCLRFHPPERGQIVVVEDGGPGGFAIKRVIGVPGDCVEFRVGRVYINGTQLREDYLPKRVRTEPLRRSRYDLRPNHYFVLGDNRGNSLDSRSYGPLHGVDIKGVVAGQN